jgi:hypothetical protein
MAVKLTAKVVKATRAKLKESGKPVLIVYDKEIRGYGIRVTRGKVALILNYRPIGGPERRLKIAELSELSIEQGRRRAAELKVNIRAGGDPLGEIRARRNADRGLTIKDVADRWLAADHGWSEATHRNYRLALGNVLPEIGDGPIQGVSKGQWAAILEDIAARSPSVASGVRRCVGSMMSWALERELLDAVRLPKRLPRGEARTRVISDSEIAVLWQASEELEPIERAFTRYMISTFVRSGAAISTRREWLVQNDDGSIAIVIPGGTRGLKRQRGQRDVGHRVVLSPWAAEQIRPALEARGLALFPVNQAELLKALRRATGIVDWQWHDLRRSARSWMASAAIGADTAETCLGHQILKDDVAKAYQRHRYEREAEAAFRSWQQHVRTIVEPGAIADNVIPIARVE